MRRAQDTVDSATSDTLKGHGQQVTFRCCRVCIIA